MSYVGTNGGNKTLAQALPDWKWEFASQVGLHTTEFPVGHSLLALFQFINTRNTHGSYHAGADAHGDSGQYCPWSWGAWHAPSINRWSVGIAANCRADEWDRMTAAQRRNLIRGMALQAHQYSRWQVANGRAPVPAKRLTKAQAERREPGFVYHGALQADRSDPTGPRDVFPWAEFLAEYRRLEAGGTTPTTSPKEKTMPWNEHLTSLVSGNKTTAGNILTHAHRAADLAAERVKALGNRVWGFGIRSLVSGNTISAQTALAYAHLRAHQALAVGNTNSAKLDALAEAIDEVLGGQGKILKAVKDVPDQVKVESAEDIAKRLKITVADVEREVVEEEGK